MMMKPEQRRGLLASKLTEASEAVSAGALAKALGVTRPVIVSDIAILRERGYGIISSNNGYLLKNSRARRDEIEESAAALPQASSDGRNLTFLMDFYELTMANGYFALGKGGRRAMFDAFYRRNPDGAGFSIFAGLEQALDYVTNMRFTPADIDYLRGKGIFKEEFLEYLAGFRFTGDIDAVPEGTVVYPNTPLITVTAPIIEAQLVETALLNCLNHQSLIATKANRVCRAAAGATVMEFGARRAQGADAAHYGARASYIGGVDATATVSADALLGVPATGTMAHSWVQAFDTEYEAFSAYAAVYPDDCTILIDTYDTLESGLPNAIRLAKEELLPRGKRLKGVRVDSGDLAYLSKTIRARLDLAGLTDCRVVASGSLDEYLISTLIAQGARIDSYGVGEKLITAHSDAVFGGVYKLCAIEENGCMEPRIKISDNVEKVTNPGAKTLFRAYNADGRAVADVLALREEDVTAPGFLLLDSQKPWKYIDTAQLTLKKLQTPVIRGGKRVSPLRALSEIRAYVKAQLEGEIWPEEQRFENPHIHYLDISRKLYDLKLSLLSRKGGAEGGK